MIILRNPSLANRIADADIRGLVQRRFAEILAGEAYDYDRHGYMIVVEAGDTPSGLEKESGCGILRNFFDDARFGDPEFTPSFEALEEHAGCYEMVFILNDEGFGIGIFIPKSEGVDPELLALCRAYAVPATASVMSTQMPQRYSGILT
jgi:hypothetical protein